ncbi:GTP cyclohydrolase II [Actinophytocola glycyrrhizae]|uniref:GTP cyclohydrolase II n=1 Tax=Actinophytocola glycyrrhizae TaxID=2044873 RepID=A0ABV9SEY6_9PSEU
MGDVNLTEHELRHADGDFRVVVLSGGSDIHGNQPCAAVFGEPEDGCLVRIHSRCVYGEIFESVDCDCRDQLRQSMAMMRKAGSGVLIYLDQEGRGAGLLAKALGYQLTQREGLDTFSSYRVLGLPEDSRSYGDAVAILRSLKLRRVRLLTNNPAKVAALSTADVQVEQQPFLVRGQSVEARRYLAAKARFGHTISLAELEADAARDRWRWLHRLLRRTWRRPAPSAPERATATVVELPVPTVNPVEQQDRPTDLVS